MWYAKQLSNSWRTTILHTLLLLFSHQILSDSETPRTARQASLSFTISQSLPKFMSTESAMPSNHLILCCPLLLLPSVFPSIRVFPKEVGICISWPKYWSFSFSISPSNEYSGLISFRVDWFDLFAVQFSSVTQSCLTLCNPMDCIQVPCPWDFPGKNTGVGCHFLLQGIFLTQGSNPHLLHWQVDSFTTEPPGKPKSRLTVF